jgi:hypothetical protein
MARTRFTIDEMLCHFEDLEDPRSEINRKRAAVKHLEYSSLVPRPQHSQSDPVAQEDFKNGSVSSSQRSKPRIPTASCRSSTKTKRGSGNKAH